MDDSTYAKTFCKLQLDKIAKLESELETVRKFKELDPIGYQNMVNFVENSDNVKSTKYELIELHQIGEMNPDNFITGNDVIEIEDDFITGNDVIEIEDDFITGNDGNANDGNDDDYYQFWDNVHHGLIE